MDSEPLVLIYPIKFPERIILEMLKAQIDAKNISAILRAKNAGIEEAKISALVLGRGSLSREKVEKAVKAKNAEEAAKVFEKEFGLSKAIESFTKTGSLIPIEVELEKGVARKGLKVLSRSVLSKGAIAGLLFLKEEEVNNIYFLHQNTFFFLTFFPLSDSFFPLFIILIFSSLFSFLLSFLPPFLFS